MGNNHFEQLLGRMADHNQTGCQRIQRLEAETKIRVIYDKHKLLLPADQDHLFDDVEFHLTFPTTSLQNWLNTYQGMFTDSISKAKKCTFDSVQSIQSYFNPL
jgi:hypothetical protein